MKLTKKQTKIILDLNYRSPAQFLFHFPSRYETWKVIPYENWEEGMRVIIQGQLASSFRHVHFAPGRSVTNFQVYSQDRLFPISAFNRSFLKERDFQNGITILGTVTNDREIVADKINTKEIYPIEITPIYPSKSGINQYEIRRLLDKILKKISLNEILPPSYQSKLGLLKRNDALRKIHQPLKISDIEKAQYSLKFEEMLVFSLGLLLEKKSEKREARSVEKALEKACLPFKLREDQSLIYKEIIEDLNRPKRMNRLLQGDVGSGKTVVSLLVAQSMVDAGYQVAFLVPTEVLLYQHLKTIREFFPQMEVAIIKQGSSSQEFQDVATGKARLVIGTHSLFQEKIEYDNLGLVIIDEQQRFGVKQREALLDKGNKVDLLMLSATPIPQTLAQSMYLDIKISTLKHQNKYNVKTEVVESNSISKLIPFLNERLEDREQVYIICPAVESSEKGTSSIRNVFEVHKKLSKTFENHRLAIMHGRLSSEEKEQTLKEFQKGEIDLLISTSVIEVGIDVHNANTMVIYNAEQFGLSTLHQMRGRVGRGNKKGYCFLLSDQNTHDDERLQALKTYNDGFKLAKIDLKNRGMGDLLGTRQSGLPEFSIANIYEDIDILKKAQEEAGYIYENSDCFTKLIEHVEKINKRKKGQDVN